MATRLVVDGELCKALGRFEQREAVVRRITDILRQVHQRSGYPRDLGALKSALQALNEGRFRLDENGEVKIVPLPLFELVGTVILPAVVRPLRLTKRFGPGIDVGSGTKMAWLDDGFRSRMLSKSGVSQPETVLCCHRLIRKSADGSILAELGGEEQAETTLLAIWLLLTRQPTGEKSQEGALSIDNSFSNIFYVRDVDGVLCAVRVGYRGDGWGLLIQSVGQVKWDAGTLVFSRSSRGSVTLATADR